MVPQGWAIGIDSSVMPGTVITVLGEPLLEPSYWISPPIANRPCLIERGAVECLARPLATKRFVQLLISPWMSHDPPCNCGRMKAWPETVYDAENPSSLSSSGRARGRTRHYQG